MLPDSIPEITEARYERRIGDLNAVVTILADLVVQELHGITNSFPNNIFHTHFKASYGPWIHYNIAAREHRSLDAFLDLLTGNG